MNEQQQNENENIQKTRDTTYFIGCINCISDVLNYSGRLTNEQQTSFKNAVVDLTNRHGIKPSIKTFYSYSGLNPTSNLNHRIQRLIKYSNFKIRKTKQIYSYFDNKGNGDIKKRYTDRVLRVIEI